MPGGRPTKYDPAMCETAVKVLAQGFSEAVLAGKLGVCVDTVLEWKKIHPEFSGAIKEGKAQGAIVWEERLATLASTGQGNATGVIFGLKNRFPEMWRDRTEQEHSGTIRYANLTEQEIDQRLAQLAAEAGAHEPPVTDA